MPQFPGSVPSFASKVPKTPAGIAVSDESHRVPASAPFVINLNQAIKEGTTPSAVCVDPAGARTPVAEGVPVTPGTFSFQRASGTAQFHSSDANREITFAYTGIGSPVRSEDLNQITGEIVAIAQYVKQLAAQRAQVLTGHIFGVAEPT
ncbi:MAG TPA: hypothetical protein VK181_06415, partial [Rhizobium sp.]|nr:hypothetical protein [Rhizobium sp.]